MKEFLAEALPSTRSVVTSARLPVCVICLPDKPGATLRGSLSVLFISSAVISAFPHFLAFDLSGALLGIVGASLVGIPALVASGLGAVADYLDKGTQDSKAWWARWAAGMLPTPESRALMLKWLFLFAAVSLLSAILFFLEAALTYLLGGEDEPTYAFFADLINRALGPVDVGRVLQFSFYAGLVLAALAVFGRWTRTKPPRKGACSSMLCALVVMAFVGVLGGMLTSMGALIFQAGGPSP